MAMRYTEKDIPNIPLAKFMETLCENPVKSTVYFNIYYPPYRDDSEPTFVVFHAKNQWHDYETGENGNIIDLAKRLKDVGDKELKAFIVTRMNDYEAGKEMMARLQRPIEPVRIKLDIKNVRLTDFMKAIGYEHPVAVDGNLCIYKAPYDANHEPTMIINTETNLWRDTKSGAYGGIYDLAYELTGTCNMSELNFYIAGQMGEFDKRKTVQGQTPKVEQPRQELEKPKRKMRF